MQIWTRVHFATFIGAVAQLGERSVRNAEVVGSTPIGSTNLPLRSVHFGSIARISNENLRGPRNHTGPGSPHATRAQRGTKGGIGAKLKATAWPLARTQGTAARWRPEGVSDPTTRGGTEQVVQSDRDAKGLPQQGAGPVRDRACGEEVHAGHGREATSAAPRNDEADAGVPAGWQAAGAKRTAPRTIETNGGEDRLLRRRSTPSRTTSRHVNDNQDEGSPCPSMSP